MNKADPSPMCKLCVELPLGVAHTVTHSGLRLQGTLPTRNGGKQTLYRCIECNTNWRRAVDLWGIDGGFRLSP